MRQVVLKIFTFAAIVSVSVPGHAAREVKLQADQQTVAASDTLACILFVDCNVEGRGPAGSEVEDANFRFGPLFDLLVRQGQHAIAPQPKVKGGTATERTSLAATVPEPGTWTLMILGLGLIGGALRRRSSASAMRSNLR